MRDAAAKAWRVGASRGGQNFVGQARRLPEPKASEALALQRHCGIVGTPRCDARSNVVYGWVAQLAEQWTENPRVGGSIPPPAIFFYEGVTVMVRAVPN